MGVAAAMRAAFRSLSSRTESRLAALENAQGVAGPVLEEVASGQAPSPAPRMAAVLADATLRDDLLAPGFLTPFLAERVRVARAAGAHITLRFGRQEDAALVETARRLLAAALAGLDAGSEVALQVHPSAEEHSALLILHVRSPTLDHAGQLEGGRPPNAAP